MSLVVVVYGVLEWLPRLPLRRRIKPLCELLLGFSFFENKKRFGQQRGPIVAFRPGVRHRSQSGSSAATRQVEQHTAKSAAATAIATAVATTAAFAATTTTAATKSTTITTAAAAATEFVF